MDNDDVTEQARSRIANGHGDALDEWRVKHAEQVVTKDARLDLSTVYKTNAHAQVAAQYETPSDANWNEWFARSFDARMKAEWVDAIGDMVAEVSSELREEIRRLQIEVAELRGELKALRGAKLWTP